jgi:hypothetical protein
MATCGEPRFAGSTRKPSRRSPAPTTGDAAREEAVAFITDQRVLESLATDARDEGVRSAAVHRLSDPGVVQRILERTTDPVVRAAAVERLAGGGAQPVDPRNVRIREMLLDPAIVKLLGSLELDFSSRFDEKRYLKDDEQTGVPTKGKVLIESLSVAVRNGGEILFKKVYKGNKGRRSEVFDSGLPVQGGYRIKVNPAEVDYVEMAEALLGMQVMTNYYWR